ncbi:MAG: hypothetical protein U0165_20510, partial [Polyangiaceae bacterium]
MRAARTLFEIDADSKESYTLAPMSRVSLAWGVELVNAADRLLPPVETLIEEADVEHRVPLRSRRLCAALGHLS